MFASERRFLRLPAPQELLALGCILFSLLLPSCCKTCPKRETVTVIKMQTGCLEDVGEIPIRPQIKTVQPCPEGLVCYSRESAIMLASYLHSSAQWMKSALQDCTDKEQP